MEVTVWGSSGRLLSDGLVIADLSQWRMADLPGQRRFELVAMGTFWRGIGENRLNGLLSVELDYPQGCWVFQRARLEGREPTRLIVEELKDD